MAQDFEMGVSNKAPEFLNMNPIWKQSFLEELERTVVLLAFGDVSKCLVEELLDISQCLKTASEVNAAILTGQSREKRRAWLPIHAANHNVALFQKSIMVSSSTMVEAEV
ncbi:hypothetical protein Vadar_016809 [Vaccinium darrowii]|uniref:Uncharacterized protein n=1 Tax=Vaccinium darrowii TaxID=229202 RepID=A0ACB7YX14_9ERIC|nr:hypothetical protein Vadar_016809 [Vaccinium darrowii]